MVEYGLHPTIWRKIRLNHSGLIEMPLFNRKGFYLGIGIISRYKSTITISDKINFKHICFKTLIKDTFNKNICPFISGNKIKICNSNF